METAMKLCFHIVLVFCTVALSNADDYDNNLTKLWSMSGATNSDGSAVLNVTSASIVIQPSSYSNDFKETARKANPPTIPNRYAFKPRAIPLRRAEQPSQLKRNVYYSSDNVNKYKSEVLFPGNYFPIAKEKSNENDTMKSGSPDNAEPFKPKAIPLIRTQEFQKRSLDVEPMEEAKDFSEQTAQRRSISYLFGDLEETEDEEDRDDDEFETEDDDVKGPKGFKSKKPKIKKAKLKKYVLPLLLAYKMKYFALVPVLIGGLILLVGATGLAGFFFALFAAVMGLQKGGY